MGNFTENNRSRPLLVPILRNLNTGIEERDDRFTTATDPVPGDLLAPNTDYSIGPNDLLTIVVGDLQASNVETTKTVRVTESGSVSVPMIGQIKASGLTEAQLEQSISQAYRDRNLLTNAQVSVTTTETRNRAFTVSGAVARGGQYAILNSDFRLLDAIALAGDVTSTTGIEYVYIYRARSQDPQSDQTAPMPTSGTPATQPTPDILAPRTENTTPRMMQAAPDSSAAANTPSTASTGAEGRTVTIDGRPMQIQSGQMVPAGAMPATMTSSSDATAPASTFEFNNLKEPTDKRVIRVPLEPLQRGELKYNIVIRPLDFIVVPPPQVGEYYLGGHISRTGVYSLTSRDITLRQAILGAGGLDTLAIPERTEIVRKVSRFQTVYARVNLAKVFAGEEPDILLKPDDQVMVGTNAIAPFLAAFRNGFRITYGFGFLYDRNFNTDNNNGN